MIEKTKRYAIDCHNKTNCRYSDKLYGFHLQMVFDTACKFIHLIPDEAKVNVLSACWAHDVIEDTRQTYNNVKAATNVEIAELVYALTNEKGKTRSDRANDKYYEGIRNCEFASFIKICDRIANVEFSKSNGGSMFHKYHKENLRFVTSVDFAKYNELIIHLNSLFNKI